MQRRNSIPNTELATDALSVGKSVVKIYSSYSAPTFNQPWQLQRSSSSTSSGFIIEMNGERFILTNAHAVSHFTQVSVKKAGCRKYPAQVLAISDTNDLALLSVADKTFWYNSPPLTIGALPSINSQMYVVGFPLGADEISYTSGVLSKVSLTTYAHSGESYLSLTTTTPINSGNSGGPCIGIQDGRYVAIGVAFETLTNASGVSFCIAPSVICHFLESYNKNLIGTSSLNIVTQSIESQVMRDALFIPPLSGLIDYFFDTSSLLSSPFTPSPETISSTPSVVRNSLDRPNTPPNCQENTSNNNNHHHRHKADKNVLKNCLLEPHDGSTAPSKLFSAQHTVIDQDADWDYVIFSPISPIDPQSPESNQQPSTSSSPSNPILHNHTPVYRFQRFLKCIDQNNNITSIQLSRRPLPESLAQYLTTQINDTGVGMRCASVVPFSPASAVLRPGDIILTINNVPIATDQTIPLRGNERVKYGYLISQCHLNDVVELCIARGFDILTVQIPIQEKQYIAKWCQYSPPQWLCALGLVFVPLTSNLLLSEYGTNWDSVAPIPLLDSLFTGTLYRSSVDEEVVVLTQILSHASNEGYEYSMRRITHVNNEKVINLKHLATIINTAAKRYDLLSKSIHNNNCNNQSNIHNMQDSTCRDEIDTSEHNLCIFDQDGKPIDPKLFDDLHDDQQIAHITQIIPEHPNAKQEVVIDLQKSPLQMNQNNNNNGANNIDDDQPTPLRLHHQHNKQSEQEQYFNPNLSTTVTNEPNNNNHDHEHKKPSSTSLATNTPIRSPTIGCLIDETDTDSVHNAKQHELAERFYSRQFSQEDGKVTFPTPHSPCYSQEMYIDYTLQLQQEAKYKYLSITLQNCHTIVLSLENGLKNQLEILKLHQLPIPGASEGILPMYDLEVQVIGADGKLADSQPRGLDHQQSAINLVQHNIAISPDTHVSTNVQYKTSSLPTSIGVDNYNPNTANSNTSHVSSPNEKRPPLAPRGLNILTPRESKIYKPSFPFPPPLQEPHHQTTTVDKQPHSQFISSPNEEKHDDGIPSCVASPTGPSNNKFPFPNANVIYSDTNDNSEHSDGINNQQRYQNLQGQSKLYSKCQPNDHFNNSPNQQPVEPQPKLYSQPAHHGYNASSHRFDYSPSQPHQNKTVIQPHDNAPPSQSIMQNKIGSTHLDQDPPSSNRQSQQPYANQTHFDYFISSENKPKRK